MEPHSWTLLYGHSCKHAGPYFMGTDASTLDPTLWAQMQARWTLLYGHSCKHAGPYFMGTAASTLAAEPQRQQLPSGPADTLAHSCLQGGRRNVAAGPTILFMLAEHQSHTRNHINQPPRKQLPLLDRTHTNEQPHTIAWRPNRLSPGASNRFVDLCVARSTNGCLSCTMFDQLPPQLRPN
jgi:hypothetical protein